MESANCTLTFKPTTQHGMLSVCIRQDKPSFAVFLWAAPMTTTQGLILLGGARLRAERSVSCGFGCTCARIARALVHVEHRKIRVCKAAHGGDLEQLALIPE